MKPYTDTYQKTMIPLHGLPLLDYIMEGVMLAGFREFILVVGYQKEQIMEHFEDGSNWDISIEYVEQKDLNGTAGAVLLCEETIEGSHFFLTWGDILVPYSVYKSVHDIFERDKEDFILVTNYLDDLQKGCEIRCEDDYCTLMVEKPPPDIQETNLNNCGIFILSTEIFDEIKLLKPSKRGELELPSAISNGISKKNWKVRVLKMEENQFRGDFGDLEVYERLKKDTSWLEEIRK